MAIEKVVEEWEQMLVQEEEHEAFVVELVVVVGRQCQACSFEPVKGFGEASEIGS